MKERKQKKPQRIEKYFFFKENIKYLSTDNASLGASVSSALLMSSIDKADTYSLAQILQWVDGSKVVHLFLIGCRALNLRLSQLTVFSSIALRRLSQPASSIKLFSNLQELKLYLRSSHTNLPLDNPDYLFQVLPSSLISLHFSFAQAPRLLLVNGEERFPHMSKLVLEGIVLDTDKITFEYLPPHLVHFQFNSDANYCNMDVKQLRSLPANLEVLRLPGVVIVNSDETLSNDTEINNFYLHLPQSLVELEIVHSREFLLNPSSLLHLKMLSIGICAITRRIGFEHHLTFATSQLPPQLEEFMFFSIDHVETIFDAPLGPHLSRFDLSILLNFNSFNPDIVSNGGALKNTNLLESEIDDDQKLVLLQKMSPKTTQLKIIVENSNVIDKMTAYLPQTLQSLHLACYSKHVNQSYLFSRLSKLNLTRLDIGVKNLSGFEQFALPSTLTDLSLKIEEDKFDQESLINVLKTTPQLQILALLCAQVDNLACFLIECSQLLSLLSTLAINCSALARDPWSKLQHRLVSPLKHLKKLDFNITEDAYGTRFFSDYMTIMSQCLWPNLEHLSIFHFGNILASKNNNDDDFDAAWIGNLPVSLKVFVIEGPSVLFAASEKCFRHLPPKLEALTVLISVESDIRDGEKNDAPKTLNRSQIMSESFAQKALRRLPSSLVSLSFPCVPREVVPLLPVGMRAVHSEKGTVDLYFEQAGMAPYKDYLCF